MFWFGLALLFILALLYLRNEWVYQARMEILREDRGSLPGYNSMLFRFWIWDIEKFIQPKK
jgi:hypothetical protein